MEYFNKVFFELCYCPDRFHSISFSSCSHLVKVARSFQAENILVMAIKASDWIAIYHVVMLTVDSE